MKKREKRNRHNANKLHGLELGDKVLVNWICSEDTMSGSNTVEGIVNKLESNMIVVDNYVIESHEILRIEKL
jgi:hypothetical protein